MSLPAYGEHSVSHWLHTSRLGLGFGHFHMLFGWDFKVLFLTLQYGWYTANRNRHRRSFIGGKNAQTTKGAKTWPVAIARASLRCAPHTDGVILVGPEARPSQWGAPHSRPEQTAVVILTFDPRPGSAVERAGVAVERSPYRRRIYSWSI